MSDNDKDFLLLMRVVLVLLVIAVLALDAGGGVL